MWTSLKVFSPTLKKLAPRTGIEELKLTTRDIPDYDQLMKGRLDILKQNNLKLKDKKFMFNIYCNVEKFLFLQKKGGKC